MTDPEADAVERVLILLRRPRRPVCLIDIGHATGLSRRQVEQAIEQARREARAPICSGSDGVWLGDEQDLAADIERGERRIRTMSRTRDGQRKLLKRLRQPTTLGF